jgi:hypothetical protein
MYMYLYIYNLYDSQTPMRNIRESHLEVEEECPEQVVARDAVRAGRAQHLHSHSQNKWLLSHRVDEFPRRKRADPITG